MGKVIHFDARPIPTGGIKAHLTIDTYVGVGYQYLVHRELIADEGVDILVDGELVIL